MWCAILGRKLYVLQGKMSHVFVANKVGLAQIPVYPFLSFGLLDLREKLERRFRNRESLSLRPREASWPHRVYGKSRNISRNFLKTIFPRVHERPRGRFNPDIEVKSW
jgi:hypothetical protein